jgi:hypothetical protein
LTSTPTIPSLEGRFITTLELLGEMFGVRPPDPEDAAGVVLFLAKAVCALALERETLAATRSDRQSSG